MVQMYPVFYGTRMMTMEDLRATFEPHMHPEAARRMFAFIKTQNGKIGVGGGYRPPGTQPVAGGFAPPGDSFHEGQPFPSGLYYAAWDLVVLNPGAEHRAPRWEEVPQQGSEWAKKAGVHVNVGVPGNGESWHLQPIELDGHATWEYLGRPDLQVNYPITTLNPNPPVPPVVDPGLPGKKITLEINSRILRVGSKGNDVKFFQRQLNDLAGAKLKVDGDFGAKMRRAVMDWQTFFHIEVSGVLGPKTQESIIEIALHST